MNILILGSGGREHAIAKKVAESSIVKEIYVAPGNPGMKSTPKVLSIFDLEFDAEKIKVFCLERKIDFVIVGPEGPLANGIVDDLTHENILVLGPTAAAARLESSKSYAKEFMRRYQIPTAGFGVCTNLEMATDFLKKGRFDSKIVVKADGLASGKGVFICDNQTEALKCIGEIFSGDGFVVNDKRIVIEEFMEGRELSLFILADGKNYLQLGTACDYKRLHSGNLGPNTGGMGSFSPREWPGPAMMDLIDKKIIKKTVNGMCSDGHPYRGFLYIGLMITDQGPKVVEYNVRLGDPEAQIILPLVETDLVPLFVKAAKGRLGESEQIEIKDQYALHVVMTSKDYANLEGRPMLLGKTIHLNDVSYKEIFFGGVAKNSSGSLINSGGRVLGVTAFGDDLASAKRKAYEIVSNISFEGAYWRDDIGTH